MKSRASGFILCALNLKLPCLCLRNWPNMTTKPFSGCWYGKRTVLWPGIRNTSNELILAGRFYFWIRPLKSHIEDGHFRVIICLILRRHTAPLLCCELCQQGGNHNGLIRCHLTYKTTCLLALGFRLARRCHRVIESMIFYDALFPLSIRDWTAQNPTPVVLTVTPVGLSQRHLKKLQNNRGETWWNHVRPLVSLPMGNP